MQNFHDLMVHVADHGQYKPNRTGIATYAEVGHMLKFDLQEMFPAVTSKKLHFPGVRGELLGFFRGYESAADFRALGCKVWDQNANETASWVNNPYRKGTDDLGRIYGVQWTKWRDTRFASTREEAKALEAKGYKLKAFDLVAFLGLAKRATYVYEREINQLEEALRTLLTDPYNRRIIINGWRPDEFDQMALPPCHVSYQFIVLPDGTLHCTMWMRSVDLFLGAPFNAASTGLFTHIMARLAGLKPGSITMFLSDTHLYENHLEQMREQVSRSHYETPHLVLSDNIRKVENLDDIKGVFARIQPEDIELVGYKSHAAIKAPMAA